MNLLTTLSLCAHVICVWIKQEFSLSVSGMSCAACSGKIERTLSAMQGVQHCAVSLTTQVRTHYTHRDRGDIGKGHRSTETESGGVHSQQAPLPSAYSPPNALCPPLTCLCVLRVGGPCAVIG